MATTSRLAFLQRLSELALDWWSAVTTAAGTTTTTVDTKLAQLSGDEDFCLNWYVRNVALGEVRRVSAYANSTWTITHAAFTTAVGNGNTYELHRIDPTLKHNALNRAAENAFPTLYLPLRDETLVVDQLLLNGDMEAAGAGPPVIANWTAAGSPTVTQEGSRVFHGSYAAKVIAGVAAGQLTQNIFSLVNVDEVAGLTLRLVARVWASVVNAARLRVTFNGSTYTNSSYHEGNSSWEGPGTMLVDVTIPTDATQMTIALEVAASQTAYFDLVVAYISRIRKYTIPASFIRPPHFVLQQHYENEVAGPYYRLGAGQTPTPGRVLRLLGMGLLSRPTTDAGTYEIGAPATELLLAHAMRFLSRAGVLQGAQRQRGRWQEDMALWEREIALLERRPGVKMAPMSADIPEAYSFEEDSSGNYIVFKA